MVGCGGVGWCGVVCGCGRFGGIDPSLRAFGRLGLPMGSVPGKPGEIHVVIASANFTVSGRCGCRAMVVMLSSLHKKRSLQWVLVRSMMANMIATCWWWPVVCESACATSIHTGCFAVIVMPSSILTLPSPSAGIAVGMQIAENSVVYVVVSERMFSGIAEMAWCNNVKIGPVPDRSHPTYNRKLVVRRSSVPRWRLDSNRCLPFVVNDRVCQLV